MQVGVDPQDLRRGWHWGGEPRFRHKCEVRRARDLASGNDQSSAGVCLRADCMEYSFYILYFYFLDIFKMYRRIGGVSI